MNSVRSKNLSLKYQSFSPSSCKDIGIRKFEFVTKTQFLLDVVTTGIFPSATFQVTISQVSTSQMDHFPSGNLLKVRLATPVGRALRLEWGGAELCG